MHQALKIAKSCSDTVDVPIGCIIVKDNKIISTGRNRVEAENNPLMHAEIEAIHNAVKIIGNKHLDKCIMYITLEPCSMCSGAIVLSRLKKLVYGAYDLKTGASGSLYNITNDKRLNHRCEVIGGILEEECSDLIKDFFKEIRQK